MPKGNDLAGAAKKTVRKILKYGFISYLVIGIPVFADGIPRTEVSSITLSFDSRKSRKLKRISHMLASDACAIFGVGCSCCFVDSGFARAFVSKLQRVCSRFLYSAFAHLQRSWVRRCSPGVSYGIFKDLLPYGREILAATSRGIYVSTNLQTDGNTLLANTTKGLYYSSNAGRGWVRR